jgi:hypothetical protein
MEIWKYENMKMEIETKWINENGTASGNESASGNGNGNMNGGRWRYGDCYG